MKTRNKILSLLVISFCLAACGKSPANNDDHKTEKEMMQESSIQDGDDKADIAQKWIDGDSKIKTEASAIAENTVKVAAQLKEKKMAELKVKLKDPLNGWQQGRVQYINVEGGFYGIITDSGMKILPMNLAKEFADDGTIVRIKGKVKKVKTTHQWGTPFTISNIELIKPSKMNM